jgi:hypothetical protein
MQLANVQLESDMEDDINTPMTTLTYKAQFIRATSTNMNQKQNILLGLHFKIDIGRLAN